MVRRFQCSLALLETSSWPLLIKSDGGVESRSLVTNPDAFEPGGVACKFEPRLRHALLRPNTCCGKCGSYCGN